MISGPMASSGTNARSSSTSRASSGVSVRTAASGSARRSRSARRSASACSAKRNAWRGGLASRRSRTMLAGSRGLRSRCSPLGRCRIVPPRRPVHHAPRPIAWSSTSAAHRRSPRGVGGWLNRAKPRGACSEDLYRRPRGRLSRHGQLARSQVVPGLDGLPNPAVAIGAVQSTSPSRCPFGATVSLIARHGPQTFLVPLSGSRERKRESET